MEPPVCRCPRYVEQWSRQVVKQPVKPRAGEVSGSIGIGLVGLGRHGSRYAQHLLEGIPGCHLAAVSRRDVGGGRAFAERHGLLYVPDWRVVGTVDVVYAVS